jgi:Mrp family chromosome partitioning ATPase
MVTKDEIINALKSVIDPELNADIVTLEMVRDVKIEGGVVEVVLALTTDSCPLSSKLREDAEAAVQEVEGVTSVNIELTVMNEAERNRLITTLKSRGMTSSLPGKMPHGKIKKVIAVLSGKGGVGKSSVASMLAVEGSRRGLKVGILDADITGPSIPKMFGEMSAPYVLEGKIIPVVSSTGIRIISMNLLTGEEEQAVIWRGPLISSAIKQFYSDVAWGELDYLIIDLPPGTSDAQLTIMQLLPVDGSIIVTSPQALADMIVSKAVNMARAMNVPILGVIENMSYIKCPNCGENISPYGDSKGESFSKKIESSFLGSLPIDPALAKACDDGDIEEYQSPAFKAIADKIF